MNAGRLFVADRASTAEPFAEPAEVAEELVIDAAVHSDECLDLVALQPSFGFDPGVAVEAAEVAVDVKAPVDKPLGHVLGVAHGEAVDDPRAGKLLE